MTPHTHLHQAKDVGERGAEGRSAGEPRTDTWSEWVLGRRHGDDADYRRVMQGMLDRIRDRVLDGARLLPGDALLDVGAGDGLIAFGALGGVDSLRVTLADVSAPLLLHAEERATGLGVRSRCVFIKNGAEKLDGVRDDAMDVVTTRSVLAYVADKGAALREFYRVLRPGGRLSIAEPIFRDAAVETTALSQILPTLPADSFLRLLHRWQASQYPSTDGEMRKSPIANYTERDLIRFCRAAGFASIHMELHIDSRPCSTSSWEVFLGISPHPWAPPLRTVLAERFTGAERRAFEGVLRPLIESGQWNESSTLAYLTAHRPA